MNIYIMPWSSLGVKRMKMEWSTNMLNVQADPKKVRNVCGSFYVDIVSTQVVVVSNLIFQLQLSLDQYNMKSRLTDIDFII